ncbi:hypothetical protein ACR56S_03615 [Staphylococcus hominis]|uniref:hypothetical protein n=1 Tax=Staphylococcus hominis TaxID=1290 RepID=UPI003DA09486
MKPIGRIITETFEKLNHTSKEIEEFSFSINNASIVSNALGEYCLDIEVINNKDNEKVQNIKFYGDYDEKDKLISLKLVSWNDDDIEQIIEQKVSVKDKKTIPISRTIVHSLSLMLKAYYDNNDLKNYNKPLEIDTKKFGFDK